MTYRATVSGRAAFCGVALLAILTACKVGPDFVRPQAHLADHYFVEGTPTPPTGAPTEDARWWRGLNDPVLDRLLEMARRNNLSLQIAGVRVLQARAALAESKGELFPQQQALGGQYVYQRTSENGGTLPGASPNVHAAALGLSVSWELDFWGKLRRAIESSDASLQASVAAYDDAVVTLTADVASLYVNIRILEERVRVAQRNIEVQQESLRIASAQFREGESNELDVQQARTELGETQAQIPTLLATLRQDRDALAVLLGDTPDQVDALLAAANGESASIPTAPASIALGIPTDLLRRRPDVRVAEYQAAAQSAQIGVAKANLFPAFTLVGDFGYLATDAGRFSPSELFKWDSRTITAGPTFSFPILNYGRIENLVRIEDAAFQQALLNYQNVVLRAQQEVADGLSAFANSQLTRDRLAEAVTAARRSSELANIRYKEGATDYTTVLTAEQSLLRVEDSYASALGSVPLALIGTYRALGGGWQPTADAPLVSEEVRAQMSHRTHWGGLLADPKPEPRSPSEDVP